MFGIAKKSSSSIGNNISSNFLNVNTGVSLATQSNEYGLTFKYLSGGLVKYAGLYYDNGLNRFVLYNGLATQPIDVINVNNVTPAPLQLGVSYNSGSVDLTGAITTTSSIYTNGSYFLMNTGFSLTINSSATFTYSSNTVAINSIGWYNDTSGNGVNYLSSSVATKFFINSAIIGYIDSTGLNFNNIYGTLMTAAQSNITSVGVLSSIGSNNFTNSQWNLLATGINQSLLTTSSPTFVTTNLTNSSISGNLYHTSVTNGSLKLYNISITSAQIGYLTNLNQNLSTTSSPTFNGLSITTLLTNLYINNVGISPPTGASGVYAHLDNSSNAVLSLRGGSSSYIDFSNSTEVGNNSVYSFRLSLDSSNLLQCYSVGSVPEFRSYNIGISNSLYIGNVSGRIVDSTLFGQIIVGTSAKFISFNYYDSVVYPLPTANFGIGYGSFQSLSSGILRMYSTEPLAIYVNSTNLAMKLNSDKTINFYNNISASVTSGNDLTLQLTTTSSSNTTKFFLSHSTGLGEINLYSDDSVNPSIGIYLTTSSVRTQLMKMKGTTINISSGVTLSVISSFVLQSGGSLSLLGSVISSTNVTNLANLNQNVSTTSSPTFVNITGTLLTAAQTNITSVGTLTSLSYAAPTNNNATFYITASGTGTFCKIESVVPGHDVELYTATSSGGLVYQDLWIDGTKYYSMGNSQIALIQGLNHTGSTLTLMGTSISSTNISVLSGLNQTLSTVSSPTFVNITGILLTAAQPNITSLGTLNSQLVINNSTGVTPPTGTGIFLQKDSGGNMSIELRGGSSPYIDFVNSTDVGTSTDYSVRLISLSTNNLSLNGVGAATFNVGTINATYLLGTITTAAQPNITSLGTLTSLAYQPAANNNATFYMTATGTATFCQIQVATPSHAIAFYLANNRDGSCYNDFWMDGVRYYSVGNSQFNITQYLNHTGTTLSLLSISLSSTNITNLSNLNQNVSTTSSPTFNTLTVTTVIPPSTETGSLGSSSYYFGNIYSDFHFGKASNSFPTYSTDYGRTSGIGMDPTTSTSLTFWTNSSEKGRIDLSGTLLIGTTTSDTNFKTIINGRLISKAIFYNLYSSATTLTLAANAIGVIPLYYSNGDLTIFSGPTSNGITINKAGYYRVICNGGFNCTLSATQVELAIRINSNEGSLATNTIAYAWVFGAGVTFPIILNSIIYCNANDIIYFTCRNDGGASQTVTFYSTYNLQLIGN